ncbi:hypothetical protein OC834_001718 [Tilletia horrida]|nr:hypothetical protein OC834_001718 [Tilletia horrida]
MELGPPPSSLPVSLSAPLAVPTTQHAHPEDSDSDAASSSSHSSASSSASASSSCSGSRSNARSNSSNDTAVRSSQTTSSSASLVAPPSQRQDATSNNININININKDKTRSSLRAPDMQLGRLSPLEPNTNNDDTDDDDAAATTLSRPDLARSSSEFSSAHAGPGSTTASLWSHSAAIHNRRISFVGPVRPGDRPAPKPFPPPLHMMRNRTRSASALPGPVRRLSNSASTSSLAGSSVQPGSNADAANPSEEQPAEQWRRQQDKMDGVVHPAADPQSAPGPSFRGPGRGGVGSSVKGKPAKRLQRPQTAPAVESGAFSSTMSGLQSFRSFMSSAKQSLRRKSMQQTDDELDLAGSQSQGHSEDETRAEAVSGSDQVSAELHDASSSYLRDLASPRPVPQSPASELQEYLKDGSECSGDVTHRGVYGHPEPRDASSSSSLSHSSASAFRAYNWAGRSSDLTTTGRSSISGPSRNADGGEVFDSRNGLGPDQHDAATEVLSSPPGVEETAFSRNEGAEESMLTPRSYTFARLSGTLRPPGAALTDDDAAEHSRRPSTSASSSFSASPHPYGSHFEHYSASSRRPSSALSDYGVVSPTPPLAFPPPPRPFYKGTLLLVRDNVVLDDSSDKGEEEERERERSEGRDGVKMNQAVDKGPEENSDGPGNVGAKADLGPQVSPVEVQGGGRISDNSSVSASASASELRGSDSSAPAAADERKGSSADTPTASQEAGRAQDDEQKPASPTPRRTKRRRPQTAPEGRKAFLAAADAAAVTAHSQPYEDDNRATLSDTADTLLSTTTTIRPTGRTPSGSSLRGELSSASATTPQSAPPPTTSASSVLERVDEHADELFGGTVLWTGRAHPNFDAQWGGGSTDRPRRFGIPLPRRSASCSTADGDPVSGSTGSSSLSSSKPRLKNLTGFVRRIFSARSSYDAGVGTMEAVLGKGSVGELEAAEEEEERMGASSSFSSRRKDSKHASNGSKAGKKVRAGLGSPSASKQSSISRSPLPKPASGSGGRSRPPSVQDNPTIIRIVSRDSARGAAAAQRRGAMSPLRGGSGSMPSPQTASSWTRDSPIPNGSFSVSSPSPFSPILLPSPSTMTTIAGGVPEVLSPLPATPTEFGYVKRSETPTSILSNPSGTPLPQTQSFGADVPGGAGPHSAGGERRDSLARRETPWEDVDSFRRMQAAERRRLAALEQQQQQQQKQGQGQGQRRRPATATAVPAADRGRAGGVKEGTFAAMAEAAKQERAQEQAQQPEQEMESPPGIPPSFGGLRGKGKGEGENGSSDPASSASASASALASTLTSKSMTDKVRARFGRRPKTMEGRVEGQGSAAPQSWSGQVGPEIFI